MVSIKDFANKNNVSYEAIRKQVKRYSDELEGHIVIENRTQYLDDFAEAFLNKQRASNIVKPKVLEQALQELEQKNHEIEVLKRQLEIEKNKSWFQKLLGK